MGLTYVLYSTLLAVVSRRLKQAGTMPVPGTLRQYIKGTYAIHLLRSANAASRRKTSKIFLKKKGENRSRGRCALEKEKKKGPASGCASFLRVGPTPTIQ